MEYDFTVLNDRDFEILANDLLSQYFRKRIERFKPGKDEGVDGRWFCSTGEVLLQYKHWVRSGVEKLITHLAGEELKKLKKLSPKRYIVATSVPLSRVNKERIKNVLSPYVASESDVFGREDLSDLLAANPEIEKRHPKLWIATANVLGQIINQGLIGRSGFVVEEIKYVARRYVETSDAGRARSLLDKAKVLIIKGEPGVGKTTLAHELLLEAVGNGYVPYSLNSIDEAESVFDKSKFQFFLFDDFLGSNLLEAIRGNEDTKIAGFIRRIVALKNKRFVLTSRSHILEQGKDCSERFRIDRIYSREFELSVGRLTEMERAKILYAHIWAGGMPSHAIESIYESQRYMRIIRHRNFNPRLVAFITDPDRIVGISKEEYWSYVERSFEHPADIWDHVFRKQIGPDVRDLAYLVGFNGRPTAEGVLKEAFRRYLVGAGENDASFSQRFHDALKLAAGSILTRVVQGDNVTLSLFNPSIGDYLLTVVPLLGVMPAIFRALATVSSLNYLGVLVRQNVVSEQARTAILLSMIDSAGAIETLPAGVAASVVVRLLNIGVSWDAVAPACRLIAPRIGQGVGEGLGDGLDILGRVFAEMPYALVGHLDELLECASELLVSIDAMRSVCAMARMADEQFGGARYANVEQAIVSVWQDNIRQFVRDDLVLSDLLDEDGLPAAEDQVYQYVGSKLESIGLAVDDDVIRGIAGEVDVADVLNENIHVASADWGDEPEAEVDGNSADAEIHDYFER